MGIRRTDLPLLVSLDALLQELNVTQAASRLNVTQSTLSGHLARLRELFDDPLLIPSENGRGMVATDRSIELQPRLHRTLLDLQDIVSDSSKFDPEHSEHTFVVAINDNAFTIVGLEVALTIANISASGLRASYIAPDRESIVNRMERGEVDLYVGASRTLPDSLKQRVLITDHFCMAQRKNHPRGARPPDLVEYCSLEHTLVSPNGGFSSPIDERLNRLGVKRHVSLTVPGYNQVALLLSDSNLVATLPSRLLNRYANSLDIFPLPFELDTFTLSMAWHSRSHQDAAHRWLRKQFLDAAK